MTSIVHRFWKLVHKILFFTEYYIFFHKVEQKGAIHEKSTQACMIKQGSHFQI